MSPLRPSRQSAFSFSIRIRIISASSSGMPSLSRMKYSSPRQLMTLSERNERQYFIISGPRKGASDISSVRIRSCGFMLRSIPSAAAALSGRAVMNITADIFSSERKTRSVSKDLSSNQCRSSNIKTGLPRSQRRCASEASARPTVSGVRSGEKAALIGVCPPMKP